MHRPVILTWVLLFFLHLNTYPQQNQSYNHVLFDFDLLSVTIKQLNERYLIGSLSLSISSKMFDMFSFSHLPWDWGFSIPLLIGNPDCK